MNLSEIQNLIITWKARADRMGVMAKAHVYPVGRIYQAEAETFDRCADQLQNVLKEFEAADKCVLCDGSGLRYVDPASESDS